MRSEDNLIKTFARCFRLLAKLNAGIKDGFFVDLISKESENLLPEYLEFLKIRGDMIAKRYVRHVRHSMTYNNATPHNFYVAQKDILQHQDVVKCCDIVQHNSRVAQYHRELISRIGGVLLLLDILKHLNLTEITAPLLLERELLKLKLLLLNNNEQLSAAGVRVAKTEGSQKNQQKNENPQTPAYNLLELNSDRTELLELGAIHRQIVEFIRNKDRVQNVEVFTRFANTTRRTLKRKLSELVKAGAIKRLALGKKVFYAISS